MKIMVLAHALRAAGGRTTCINILNAIKKIDPVNHYYIVVPDQKEYLDLELEDPKRIIYYYRRQWGDFGRMIFDKLTLNKLAKANKVDLVWALGGLGFSNPPCMQVVSIQNPHVMYDIHQMGRLSMVDWLKPQIIRWKFRRQLPKTHLVVCQTATMELRLRKKYNYQGETKITGKAISAYTTNWNGNMPKTIIPYKNQFKLFYLTRYYPHKGLEMLVEVMGRYKEELLDTIVVITIDAEQHKSARDLLDKIKKYKLEERIINVGPLKQEQLADYYSSCDCLVMPTRLESFSGTYLEAMHFGLPILTSNLDFAHEVCGDAALYFDPLDASSIKDSILRIKNDPNLKNALIKKGKVRLSENFGRTWEDIVENVLQELSCLVNQKRTNSS